MLDLPPQGEIRESLSAADITKVEFYEVMSELRFVRDVRENDHERALIDRMWD